MSVFVRRAVAEDQRAIEALVRSERLNPTGLRWVNFWVAVDGERAVGAVQVRAHADGGRELGSLVLQPDYRKRGLSDALVDQVWTQFGGVPVYAVTSRLYASHMARWGFRPVPASTAPASLRRNHLIGSLMAGVSLLRGLQPRRLVILRRDPDGRA